MKSYKRMIHSALLGRMAHADVFELGTEPDFLYVHFSGSGVHQEEYELRSQSVSPIFGPLLEWLGTRSRSLVLVYVSAPYDVPYNRFASEPLGIPSLFTRDRLRSIEVGTASQRIAPGRFICVASAR